MKRLIAFTLSVLMIFGLCLTASAEHTHTLTNSTSGSSGAWINQPTMNLAYSSDLYDHVCGGDVGIWFYTSNVGLQSGFIQSVFRVAYFEQYEKDGNSEIKTRDYRANFGTNGTLYQPVGYSNTYTNGSSIEDDGVVELYFKYWVTTVWQDTSNAVPAGLFYYTHWAY